jgi:hypothetical protein
LGSAEPAFPCGEPFHRWSSTSPAWRPRAVSRRSALSMPAAVDVPHAT